MVFAKFVLIAVIIIAIVAGIALRIKRFRDGRADRRERPDGQV